MVYRQEDMKYYYDDALKAAWMILNHSIRLIDGISEMENFQISSKRELGTEIYTIKMPCEYGWTNARGAFVRHNKPYVHPDCYEMLKPQIGDLVELNAPDELIFIVHGLREDCSYIPLLDDRYGRGYKYELKSIIQRNGIAFFMPKVEE